MSSKLVTTLMSQYPAIVRDILDPCALSNAKYPDPYASFVTCLRDQLKAATLPITMFTISHRYIIATVLLPDGRKTYIRADCMRGAEGKHSRLAYICASPSPAATQARGHAATPAPFSEPSLDDLTTLFEIADKRTCKQEYNFFAHRCIWMAEMLFYTFARLFHMHWPARSSSPAWLVQKFLRRERSESSGC